MDLASGQVTDSVAAHLAPAGNNLAKTPGPPALIGWATGQSYYDVPNDRWLPALPQWVAPSGAAYLYSDYDAAALHMVDVTSGIDRTVASDRRLYPLAWTVEGAYVMDFPSGSPVQVYALTLATGQLQPLGARLALMAPVGGGGAWTADVLSGVPAASGTNGRLPNSLSRTDLQTGRTVVWYTQPDAAVSMVGFARDGSVLMETTAGGSINLLRLTGPMAVAETYPLPDRLEGLGVTDQHGTWLVDVRGEVLLYQEGSPPRLVATAPSSVSSLRLAGGC